LPLSEKARIELYLPDLPRQEYRDLLEALDREFAYTFGGASIVRGIEGSYLSQAGSQIRDRINFSVLAKKHKELIAVGISVATDCESCMQWHIEQAAAASASEREVLEAVEVGIEMAGGPGTVSARFALEGWDHQSAAQHAAGSGRGLEPSRLDRTAAVCPRPLSAKA
jgi:AhpD family alkylhydroperoxidase